MCHTNKDVSPVLAHPNTHMYVPGNSVCYREPTRPLGPRSNKNKQGEGMAEWGQQKQVPAHW